MKAKTCQANNGGKSMITVVNPIYDCVFKYLMEDERIAKTLLTALLKKEVVSVECDAMSIPTPLATTLACFVSTSPLV